MFNKYSTVRSRCRKGIPPSIRGKAWKYLCGATYQMEVSANRTVFDRCLDQAGDPKWIDDIEKDLSRQFPNHEMFSRYGKYGDGGKDDLFQLLKAWTVLHPEEGYCQGQAPVASVLLMHMPLRDAFYCFVQVCHRYLPDYYSPGLEAVQVDGDILAQLLKEKSRISYQHLKSRYFLRRLKLKCCKPNTTAVNLGLRRCRICELNLNDADLEKIHFRALKLRQIKISQK
ncbi:TBC domain protein [Necator americanus]|uniref:TBC domain protein n=1 Tax=Necator americanus TaxID=51031 RepID=W2T591_NECAM|nr:TBC domain protein [Necator americanus]ETN76336.1 TBC domain protein [Necator americanus]